ncbi:hypothetical protein CK203_045299 [Vitis vinifera]|uniref:Uncharacterized protein n=1 Tax=Vitis vinifera TaxID=29760 RepID=A0A438HII5_VITVI|nr:hypothetical protein CK203_045299 [Vitis vinifera]
MKISVIAYGAILDKFGKLEQGWCTLAARGAFEVVLLKEDFPLLFMLAYSKNDKSGILVGKVGDGV